jgi:hypothetical protein
VKHGRSCAVILSAFQEGMISTAGTAISPIAVLNSKQCCARGLFDECGRPVSPAPTPKPPVR